MEKEKGSTSGDQGATSVPRQLVRQRAQRIALCVQVLCKNQQYLLNVVMLSPMTPAHVRLRQSQDNQYLARNTGFKATLNYIDPVSKRKATPQKTQTTKLQRNTERKGYRHSSGPLHQQTHTLNNCV